MQDACCHAVRRDTLLQLMRNKTRIVIGLVLALGVAGAFWWLERATRPADAQAERPGLTQTTATTMPVVPPTGTLSVTESFTSPSAQAGDSGVAAPEGDGAVPQVPQPLLTAGDILAEPDDDYVRVAKKLSALVLDPRASMEEREEALAHALNLSAGSEAEVLTPLVTNPALPDSLTETILGEALNRPLAYQADLYLAALAVRKSPEMQTLIREHLAFLTGGEDLGSDPKAWAEAIKTAKKEWGE